jgi:hypothetical protein
MPNLGGPALIYWPQHKGLRGALARMIAADATLRRGLLKSVEARVAFYSRTRRFFLRSE